MALSLSFSRTIFRVGVSPIAERQRAPGRSFAESKARPRRAWPERATRQCALQPIAATACGSSLYYFTLTLSFPRGSNSSSTTWFALTPISSPYGVSTLKTDIFNHPRSFIFYHPRSSIFITRLPISILRFSPVPQKANFSFSYSLSSSSRVHLDSAMRYSAPSPAFACLQRFADCRMLVVILTKGTLGQRYVGISFATAHVHADFGPVPTGTISACGMLWVLVRRG